MASSSSWPSSDILSKCFILVRWLHAHGVAWSGTPSELAAQMTAVCDGAPWFSNADELLKFMETNADVLRDLGFESSVRRSSGRVTIDLQINTRGAGAQHQDSTDLSRQLAAMESVIDQPQRAHVAEPIALAAAAPRRSIAEVSGNRLYELTGVPLETVPPATSSYVNVKQQEPRTQEPSAPTRKNRLVPIGASVAALVLILAIWMFNSSRPDPSTQKPSALTKVETKAEPPAPIAAPEQPKPVEPNFEPINPIEAEKTNALLDQASSTKLFTSQYELAMRYAQGIGVQRDNGYAYAWLTLARANGSLEADSAMQNLGSLSADEMQRARIEIGKAFTSGVCVRRNYLLAYQALLLAERSGSPEAATLKKELEAKMPAWQIEQAGGPKQKQNEEKD